MRHAWEIMDNDDDDVRGISSFDDEKSMLTKINGKSNDVAG